MNSILSLRPERLVRLAVLFTALLVPGLAGASEAIIAAVRAADDARVAATVKGDRAGLERAYSDQLTYGHSSGKVDNKRTQIEGLLEGPNRFERFEYLERTFKPVAPGIVTMTGRVKVHMANRTSGEKNVLDLTFLSIWREEQGQWRFLAWQSARNPPAAAK